MYETYWTVPFRDRICRDTAGVYRVGIQIQMARERVEERFETLPSNTAVQVLDRHLFVAAAGPDWIGNEQLESIDDLVYALPEVYSNVKGGTGYVVGIVSKTITDPCP